MTSATALEPESLVYTEVTDNLPEPTQEDVEEYAKRIGIDVKNEPHLLPLAREGIQAKLPCSWSPCLDTTKDSFYYFNKDTLKSQWEHPMDPIYREKVIRARGELALSRPPTLQRLNMRLPPVKKSGASLAPIKRAGGSLGSLGGFGPGAGDLRSTNTANSNQDSANANVNTLSRHNNANSRNIISGSSLNSFKDTDDDDNSPPTMRPPRKLGLTLTGGGANFLKGSGEEGGSKPKSNPSTARGYREGTPDSDETGGGGDSDKRPIKSILVNSISRSRPPNPSDNVYELDGFSMNLDEMTEEEKNVVSQLDSASSKSKGNSVKFNLDDNTELKFEMPGDENEDVEDPDDEAESDYDEGEEESTTSNKLVGKNQNAQNKSFDVYFGGSGDSIRQPPNNKNQLPFSSEYSESDIAALKAAMREGMEAELTKFKDQLEEERKARQEQIQKHLEETVAQFKMEKDETLKRIRKDMENEKAFEVDKAKREIDNLLKRELEEMKNKFDDALQQRRQELEEETEKKIQEITLEYRKKEENRISETLERQSSEEMLKIAEGVMEKQKESLKEEQQQELLQLKEHYKTTLERAKADLQVEEQKLRQDHSVRRAEIVTKFERETEDLKKKLVRTQEEALKKVQDEFETKKAALEKSLNASLQSVKDLIHQNKRSASDTNISDRTTEDELRSMKFKYQELEGKYHKMKQELQQLTQDISERKDLIPVTSQSNDNDKKAMQASANSKQSSKKSIRAKPIMDKIKGLDGSDSAHGSETNSDSNSSVYPSSGGVNGSKLQRADTADDPEDELGDVSQADRINAALHALEILKKEILELKQSNSKKQTVKAVEKSSSDVATNNQPMSARRAPSRQDDLLSARKRSSINLQSAKGSKSARTKDFSGSNSEVNSEDTHQRIVEDAKAFIRMQKNRLKDPTPITNSSHLILPTTKNNLLLFDEKLLKSVSPRRPAAVHLDLVSETESSGVSSLKDHRSSESKKLSRDIDEICNSLNSLDQQMKMMWSVVKGKQEQHPLQDESLSYFNVRPTTDLTAFLPNTVPMLLGKSSRVSASLPLSARKPLVPPTSPVKPHSPTITSSSTGSAGRNYSSLLSTTHNPTSQTVLDALRMSGMSTTRLDCSDLLKSLEEELKEFKSTKQKLLDMQNGPFGPSSHEKNHATTTSKPNNNNTSTILEKTKDLQEWLKKY